MDTCADAIDVEWFYILLNPCGNCMLAMWHALQTSAYQLWNRVVFNSRQDCMNTRTIIAAEHSDGQNSSSISCGYRKIHMEDCVMPMIIIMMTVPFIITSVAGDTQNSYWCESGKCLWTIPIRIVIACLWFVYGVLATCGSCTLRSKQLIQQTEHAFAKSCGSLTSITTWLVWCYPMKTSIPCIGCPICGFLTV